MNFIYIYNLTALPKLRFAKLVDVVEYLLCPRSIIHCKFGLWIFQFGICTVAQIQYLLYLVVLLGCRHQKSSDSQILIVVKVQECTRATWLDTVYEYFITKKSSNMNWLQKKNKYLIIIKKFVLTGDWKLTSWTSFDALLLWTNLCCWWQDLYFWYFEHRGACLQKDRKRQPEISSNSFLLNLQKINQKTLIPY